MKDQTMNTAQTIQEQDAEAEYQMRLQLRAALFHALALLTDPDAEPEDADRVTALITKTLEETAP
jgi:hypothetical protein